jgi:hypothetical protein
VRECCGKSKYQRFPKVGRTGTTKKIGMKIASKMNYLIRLPSIKAKNQRKFE